jgi:VWFA-related protein
MIQLADILYLQHTMRTVCTLAALLFSALALSQESFTVSVDVSLIALDVEVTDSTGRPVTNLSRDAFQIYEDGVLQELRSFDSVETPYNVLLLFDCSPSTEREWPVLVEAMNRFAATLRLQDRVAIAQFGSGFRILKRWFGSTERGGNVEVQTRDSVCSGTDFYGALQRGLEELRAIKGRKGMVVLSDGAHGGIPYQRSNAAVLAYARYIDAADDRDFQRLTQSVANSQALLYFVAVNTDLNPDGGRPGTAKGPVVYDPMEIYNKQQVRSRIELLATISGGRAVYPRRAEDVIGLYERIANELGASYSLGYTPSNLQKDGRFRSIQVRVNDRSLQVRQSRDGYTAR